MTTRRRVLTILAGAATLPALGLRAADAPAQWRGIALGAEAHIVLDHPDGEHLIAMAVDEIHRLEAIFSLYKTDSQLARLNGAGVLENPAFEMLELLSITSQVHAQTGGAFDPTVQPIWALYAEHAAVGGRPSADAISARLLKTGLENVTWSAAQVSFAKPGMQLTLNGIAQGFIADKVADILRAEGVKNVLVNTGEIAALGVNPDGAAWPVGLQGGHVLHLSDRAIATSAPLGTTFDQAATIGHILDPRTGMPASLWSRISVISTSACRADALSTAFCVMARTDIDRALEGTSEEVLLIEAL